MNNAQNDRLATLSILEAKAIGIVEKANIKLRTLATMESLMAGHSEWFNVKTTSAFNLLQKNAQEAEKLIPEYQRERKCILENKYFDHDEYFHYGWGKLVETVRIESQAEEIVLYIINKVMEKNLYLKTRMFEILFGLEGQTTEYNCWTMTQVVKYYATHGKNTFRKNAQNWAATNLIDALELISIL